MKKWKVELEFTAEGAFSFADTFKRIAESESKEINFIEYLGEVEDEKLDKKTIQKS